MSDAKDELHGHGNDEDQCNDRKDQRPPRRPWGRPTVPIQAVCSVVIAVRIGEGGRVVHLGSLWRSVIGAC
jgi:hypothetical protein